MTTTTKISWKTLVDAANEREKPKDKEETAYEFSNGREFKRPNDPYESY